MAKKNTNTLPEEAFGKVLKELRLKKGISQQVSMYVSESEQLLLLFRTLAREKSCSSSSSARAWIAAEREVI